MSERLRGVALFLVLGALVVLGLQQRALQGDVATLRSSLEGAAAAPSPAPSQLAESLAPVTAEPWEGEYDALDAVGFWWAAQISGSRSAAAPWQAGAYVGDAFQGYGPAKFSCSDGADGRQSLSAASESAQCEGVASNGPSDYASLVSVRLVLVDGRWRVAQARAQGDAG